MFKSDEEERKFNQALKELGNAPVETVSDFQKPLTKQYTVDKRINSSEPLKIKSGADFMAEQVIGDAKREAKLAALGKIGDTIDYSKFKKGAKTVGKKVLSAAGLVPGVGTGIAALGGLASALSSQDASAAVPVLDSAETLGPAKGSLDERLERGTLTEEDKQAIKLEQARIRALQGIR